VTNTALDMSLMHKTNIIGYYVNYCK